jgi:AcrR family transcriptional regulator
MTAGVKIAERLMTPQASRGARKREAILQAAASLLVAEGAGAFTIGALVERTGIPRMTIYRHWPSRDSLLATAMASLPEPVELPQDSRTRILTAAVVLLVERGTGGFVIDAVAARAGIAKTTIYRYWASRAELLSASVGIMGEIKFPDTGAIRSDLFEFVMAPMREWKERGCEIPNVPGLIEAIKRDPELAEIGLRLQESNYAAIRPILERAQVRGEIRADRDIEMMAHILYGSMFIYGGLGQAPSEAFVAEMVDTFLDGVRTR